MCKLLGSAELDFQDFALRVAIAAELLVLGIEGLPAIVQAFDVGDLVGVKLQLLNRHAVLYKHVLPRRVRENLVVEVFRHRVPGVVERTQGPETVVEF